MEERRTEMQSKTSPHKKVAAASVYVGFSRLMQYECTLNLVLWGQKTKLEKQSSADSALGEVGLQGYKIYSGKTIRWIVTNGDGGVHAASRAAGVQY